MYGDPDVLRRRASQLRERGADVRAVADGLVSRTEASAWSGRAAAALQERVRERATDLREVASRHEDAAEALEQHLAETAVRREAIAQAERRVRALVAEAGARVRRVEQLAAEDAPGVTRIADPIDLAVLSLELPTAGHRAWLTLEVPGARPATTDLDGGA